MVLFFFKILERFGVINIELLKEWFINREYLLYDLVCIFGKFSSKLLLDYNVSFMYVDICIYVYIDFVF